MSASTALAAIRAREQAATPGPWVWHVSDDRRWVDVTAPNYERVIATTHDDDLAEFIAHARTDVPRMAAALDAVLALDPADSATASRDYGRGYAQAIRDARAAITDALDRHAPEEGS